MDVKNHNAAHNSSEKVNIGSEKTDKDEFVSAKSAGNEINQLESIKVEKKQFLNYKFSVAPPN